MLKGWLAAGMVAALSAWVAPARSVAPADQPVQGGGAEVPAAFRPFYQGVIVDEEAARAALPCEWISVRLSGGLMIGDPVFTVRLWRSGRAELSAGNAFRRTGDYVGEVGLMEFGKLCQLADSGGFLNMQPRYAVHVGDLRTWTVGLATRNVEKTVVDYGGAGPVELWAIEQAAQSIVAGIAWKPK